MSSKRRFLCCHLSNDFSGSPRMLAELIRTLKAQGESVKLVCSASRGFLSAIEVEKLTFSYEASQSLPIKALRFFAACVAMAWIVTAECVAARRERGSLILICNTHLTWPAALAGKIFNIKIVWYVHERSLRPKFLAPLMRWAYRMTADLSIFPSEFLRETTQSRAPTIVLPNCLNDVFFSRPLPAPKKDTVLFVGSVASYKGFGSFVALARKLPSIRFEAALSDSRVKVERKYGALLESAPNVAVYTQPSDIVSMYDRARVIVNLSDSEAWVETFALTVMEGMSRGCYFLAPVLGGHVEYCGQGDGALIDSKDITRQVQYVASVMSVTCVESEISKRNVDISKRFSSQRFCTALISELDRAEVFC